MKFSRYFKYGHLSYFPLFFSSKKALQVCKAMFERRGAAIDTDKERALSAIVSNARQYLIKVIFHNRLSSAKRSRTINHEQGLGLLSCVEVIMFR